MGLEEGLRRVRIGLIRRIGRFGIRRRYISLHVDVLFFLVVVQRSTSFVLMVP